MYLKKRLLGSKGKAEQNERQATPSAEPKRQSNASTTAQDVAQRSGVSAGKQGVSAAEPGVSAGAHAPVPAKGSVAEPAQLGDISAAPQGRGMEEKGSVTTEVEESALGAQVYLGCGEFCTAHRTKLDGGKLVAVKTLKESKRGDKTAIGDLEREMQLMSRMDHPNILKVVAVGHYSTGLPFMCLQLLATVLSAELPKAPEEVSYWKRQQSIKKWPVHRGVQTALGLASALAYCHHGFSKRYRILHRDLKPNNIGFLSDGRVVLFDFGVCCFWDLGEGGVNNRPNERRTLTGMTGSLRYMAPEVALEQPYNHKAEVFSFASVFWEMLSHARPFAWMDSQLYLDQACRRGVRCQLSKSWPAELKNLITACWSPEPDKRPSFEELIPQLQDILKALPVKGDR